MAHTAKVKQKGVRDKRKLGKAELRSKIVEALNSKRYRARTIAGIAKMAHVNPVVVVSTIKNDPSLREMVKVYPRKSSKGEVLLTTKDRFYKEASFSDKFVDAFATKRWGLDDA